MRHIEIIQTGTNSFTVIVDGLFADQLTVDEALGSVASALFSEKSRPLFLKSYVEWKWWHDKYCGPPPTVAGLIGWHNQSRKEI